MTIYVCGCCGAKSDEAHNPACEFAGKSFRTSVKQADYVCRFCGAKGGELHKDTCPFAPFNAALKDTDSYQVGGDHYMELAVQPWKAMESWMSEAEFAGFLRGNVIKYLSRAGKKGDELQDLKKALHYLEKLVSVKETGK
jgi:hypothetical protein